MTVSGAPRSTGPDGPDGLLVVDKPPGWTSHDVVARTRQLLRTRRVGHAGTLDPMATGVLVLGVGRATRLLTYLVGADKEYLATIRLGQATVTDDAEGEVVASPGAVPPAADTLAAALAGLTGAIDQVPSTVSAIKVGGQRAYARARAGEEVALTARPVTVDAFELGEPRPAVASDGTAVVDVDARVVCSSGTYVRALARDLGAALGTAGHLTALRRTRVGGFGLDGAVDVSGDDAAPPVLIDLAASARATFAARELTAEEARELSFGRALDPTGPTGTAACPVAAFGPDGRLVALLADERGKARPVLVLAPA